MFFLRIKHSYIDIIKHVSNHRCEVINGHGFPEIIRAGPVTICLWDEYSVSFEWNVKEIVPVKGFVCLKEKKCQCSMPKLCSSCRYNQAGVLASIPKFWFTLRMACFGGKGCRFFRERELFDLHNLHDSLKHFF